MKSRFVPLVILIVGVWATPANAITISNHKLIDQVIKPLRGTTSAAEYYRFNNLLRATGDPAFGTRRDTAFFWLYRNTDTKELSLNMIFDRPGDGTGGEVSLALRGIPDRARVTVSDDRNELKIRRGDFKWVPRRNDGGVIDRINGFDLIRIALRDWKGINRFFFLSGNAQSPDRFRLNPNRVIRIARPGTEVPEPGSLVLLGAGLMGLVRRRKKKAEVC